MTLAQILREIGPRAHMAFRHARVGLWRFKRSPQQQDRAAMIATFAFIGLFAVGSVDAIITGGADFAPGSAYAAEYQPARIVTAPAAPVVDITAAEDVAAEEADKAVETTNYAYTTETLLGAPEAELAVVEEPVIEDAAFGYKAEIWEQLLVVTDEAAVF